MNVSFLQAFYFLDHNDQLGLGVPTFHLFFNYTWNIFSFHYNCQISHRPLQNSFCPYFLHLQATDKADKVLAAASGHSLVSGVLSLAGGSDSPSEAQDLMPEITEQREDKMLTRPVGHYKMSQPETDIQLTAHNRINRGFYDKQICPIWQI